MQNIPRPTQTISFNVCTIPGATKIGTVIVKSVENPNAIHCSTWIVRPACMRMLELLVALLANCRAPAVSVVDRAVAKTRAVLR